MSAPASPSTTDTARKKVFIKTWGCQMNVYDSQRMTDVLRPMGYGAVETAAEADLVILNTCHIREKASEKLFSELGRLRAMRAELESHQMFAVAGCVAQAEGEEIINRAPFVDMVFGPQTYHLLPEMVAQAEAKAGGAKSARVVNTDFPVESKFDLMPVPPQADGVTAFLSIQEGCDKFCTFCVVPYTRGAEYSRGAAQVLDEAKLLIAQGVRDISLLGQNVNAWHGDGLESGSTWDFARLLYALAELPGLDRIRYTTSHPRDMSNALIAAHGAIPQLMPYLHLPVQSGSDTILAAMNRKHGRDRYFDIIDRLRAARPDIAFTSDFIVGFPGETEADHAQTMEMVSRVDFALAYSFKYSRRPGTPGATLPGQLKEDVKDARLLELQALLFQQQTAFNRSKIGQTVPVLFDRPGRNPGQVMGRSPWLQSVYVSAPERIIGQILPVRVTGATQNSLTGDIVTTETIAA